MGDCKKRRKNGKRERALDVGLCENAKKPINISTDRLSSEFYHEKPKFMYKPLDIINGAQNSIYQTRYTHAKVPTNQTIFSQNFANAAFLPARKNVCSNFYLLGKTKKKLGIEDKRTPHYNDASELPLSKSPAVEHITIQLHHLNKFPDYPIIMAMAMDMD